MPALRAPVCGAAPRRARAQQRVGGPRALAAGCRSRPGLASLAAARSAPPLPAGGGAHDVRGPALRVSRTAADVRPLVFRPSQVAVRKAYEGLYAAVIDKKVAMKIGPGDWRCAC